MESVVSKENTAGGAGKSRAVGLFLLKRYEEAAAAFDELSMRDPDDTASWTNAILCRLQYSRPDAVFFDEMRKRVGRLPAQGYLCLAEVLNSFDRYGEALVFADKALSVDPDNADACLLKAGLLDALNRTDEQYAFVKSFYPRLKRDERVLCYAAFYAALFWNTRQASFFLKKALKANKHAALQNTFFYAALTSGHMEKDIIAYGADALNDRADNPVVWMAVANADAALGEYDAADEAFGTLAGLTDIPDNARLNWARVLIEKKSYDRAAGLLEHVSGYSDTLFSLIRTLLFAMRADGLKDTADQKAAAFRAAYGNMPQIDYLCAAFSGGEIKHSAPIEFIDAASELPDPDASPDRKSFLANVLDKAFQTAGLSVAKSMAVLDIGCGAGDAAPFLRDYSRPDGSLTGIDVSETALAAAQSTNAYDRLEESDLLAFCATCEDRYDLIVCSDALYWFADPAPVFAAVERVLKPDGVFIFTVTPQTREPEFSADVYGRFSHNPAYVSASLSKSGLVETGRSQERLYRTDDRDYPCVLFTARKKPQ